MVSRPRPESRLSRRSVLGLGIAASATAMISLTARQGAAKVCGDLKPPFEKVDDSIQPDPANAENPGKLAKLILMTKNDQYYDAAQGIYFLGKQSITQQIQRDGTDPA